MPETGCDTGPWAGLVALIANSTIAARPLLLILCKYLRVYQARPFTFAMVSIV